MSTDNKNKFKKRIATGIWEDADGMPHFSIPELLAMVNLPDTPENQARVAKIIEKAVRKENPKCEIVFRQTPND